MPTPYQTALTALAAELGLPEGDTFTQDWPYEVPQKYRTEAHLTRYTDALSTPTRPLVQRQLLLELVLDIANDRLESDQPVPERTCAQVEREITRAPEDYTEILQYWSAWDTEPDAPDAFAVTPAVRRLTGSRTESPDG